MEIHGEISILSTLRWLARARATLLKQPRALNAETANLLLEMTRTSLPDIEELKKYTTPKATDLEYEIIMLRKDIESLRISLGVEDKFSEEPPKPKPEETEKGKLKFKILK